MSKVLIAILTLASTLLCGCPWKRSTRAVQLPPAPAFVPPLPKPLSRTAPELEPAPDFSPEPPSYATALDFPPAEVPPAPQPPPRRRTRPEIPVAQQEQEPAVEEPAEQVPQLVEILSPEKKKQYDEAIEMGIGQAEKSLKATAGRNLNPEQTESANLIRSFVSQAKEARHQDPVRARSLAERASVLAQHLEKSIR